MAKYITCAVLLALCGCGGGQFAGIDAVEQDGAVLGRSLAASAEAGSDAPDTIPVAPGPDAPTTADAGNSPEADAGEPDRAIPNACTQFTATIGCAAELPYAFYCAGPPVGLPPHGGCIASATTMGVYCCSGLR